MMQPIRVVADEVDCPSPHIVSVSANRGNLFAAAFGKCIFRKSRGGAWLAADQGLPDGVVVNRLQSIDESLYVCTNKGLFYHDDHRWYPTEITFPCYQVSKQGVFFAAATEYGLWCKVGTRWEAAAYSNTAVYDVLLTPQFYLIGAAFGIALYDRYTASWAEFPLGTAVTGLAGHPTGLLGITSEGKLVYGNIASEFMVTGFEDLTLYTLKSIVGRVYVCTSQGLYLIVKLGQRLLLQSVLTDYPVTDLVCNGDGMYVATLHCGMKRIVHNGG